MHRELISKMMGIPAEPRLSPTASGNLADDYQQWGRDGWPDDWEQAVLERYHVDLSTEYGGFPIRNPFGKASGQLSMTPGQVRDDVAAGLGFVVLKTVIAEDEEGSQSMGAWAIPEARMIVEPIQGRSGESGWTVTWSGRGWSRSFEEYLAFVRQSRELSGGSRTLIVPSCKFHLPAAGEAFREQEYRHTLTRLGDAYGGMMPLEKDFSPTLAGSDLAGRREQILHWLQSLPEIVARATEHPVRLGLKLFNSRFDDEFQLQMLSLIHATAARRCDYFIYGNRLFDPDKDFEGRRGVAYGGPDLSDRNLRIMQRWRMECRREGAPPPLPWSATGNIINGRIALAYALCGASSFQMHTLFQLPEQHRSARTGNRTRRALHELLLHPRDGLLAWLLHAGAVIGRANGLIRFQDIVGRDDLFSARGDR